MSPQELKLAKTLIDATSQDAAEIEQYRDLYAERMRELVDAKIAGHEVARPGSSQKAPPTINLIEALKASLEYKKTRAAVRADKAARKTGGTRRGRGPTKRKTG